MIAVAHTLGLRRTVHTGHSLGGAVALQAAVQDTEAGGPVLMDPGSRLVRFAEAGHYVHEEATEGVARAIEAWLRDIGLAPHDSALRTPTSPDTQGA